LRVGREQVLSFRVARHGLAERRALTLAEAAACPLSDVTRGTALVAVAARARDVRRDAFERAIDDGALVLAPTLRAALHVTGPDEWGSVGRALVADDEVELIAQLGGAAQRHLDQVGVPAREAVAEVAAATEAALAGGRALSKGDLHEELRHRVRAELLPWCQGCGSHHVSPMVWRYGGVQAGMRMDSSRRFRCDGAPAGEPARAVRRFLQHYGPSTPKDFAAWAGLAIAHARRLWDGVEAELAPVDLDGRRTWLLVSDEPDLGSPPVARGVRLLPARDAYIQQPDRATLVPDKALSKRLFRPMGDPGAVLVDGRLAGLWRGRMRGRRLAIEVESLERIPRTAFEEEAQRVAEVRQSAPAVVTWV